MGDSTDLFRSYNEVLELQAVRELEELESKEELGMMEECRSCGIISHVTLAGGVMGAGGGTRFAGVKGGTV